MPKEYSFVIIVVAVVGLHSINFPFICVRFSTNLVLCSYPQALLHLVLQFFLLVVVVPVSHAQDQNEAVTEAVSKVLSFQFINPDSTVLYARQASRLAKKQGDESTRIVVESLAAVAEVDRGHIQEGFRQANSLFQQAQRLGDSAALAYSKFALGSAVGQQITRKVYDSVNLPYAIHILQESVKYGRAKNDSTLLVEALNATGRIYRRRQIFDSALTYHKEAQTLAYFLKLPRPEGWAWNSMSICYVGLNNLPKALLCALQGLALREQAKINYSIAISHRQVSSVYSKMGNQKLAKEYAQKNLLWAEKARNILETVEALERVSEVYEAEGNFQQALTYRKRFEQEQDSLVKIEYRSDLNEALEEAELVRVTAEKKILEQEQIQERILQQRLWLVIGLVLVIGAALAYIAYISRKTKRQVEKRNTELLEANSVIAHQNLELKQQAEELTKTSKLLMEYNSSLNNAVQFLEERESEKSELFDIFANDFSTPLTAVREYAEQIEKRLAETSVAPEETIEASKNLVQTSDKMLDLVKNLLEINRMESYGERIFLIPRLVAPMLEATVWKYKVPAEEREISIHFTNTTPESIVLSDEQALATALEILMTNALAVTENNGNIWVRVESRNMKLRIEIEDEGSIRTHEEVKKIFGKYIRLSPREAVGEKTGVELSVVKKFIEGMKGKVWYEGKFDKGATFVIELPKEA